MHAGMLGVKLDFVAIRHTGYNGLRFESFTLRLAGNVPYNTRISKGNTSKKFYVKALIDQSHDGQQKSISTGHLGMAISYGRL